MRTARVQLTVDEQLIATAEPSTVIEPAWWSAAIYGSLKDFDNSLAPFTREQRLMVALQWYIAEVNNGGHDQFYFNSTGIVWPDAVAAFQALDVAEGVRINQESARRLGGAPARDRAERQKQLEAAGADFSDVDDRSYRLQETVHLDEAMIRFIRAHAERPLFSGTVERPVR